MTMDFVFRPIAEKLAGVGTVSVSRLFENSDLYSVYLVRTSVNGRQLEEVLVGPVGTGLESHVGGIVVGAPVPNFNYVAHSVKVEDGREVLTVEVKYRDSVHELVFTGGTPIVYNKSLSGKYSISGVSVGAIYFGGVTHVRYSVYVWDGHSLYTTYSGENPPPRHVFTTCRVVGVAVCARVGEYAMTVALAPTRRLNVTVRRLSLPLPVPAPVMDIVALGQETHCGETVIIAFAGGDRPDLAKQVAETVKTRVGGKLRHLVEKVGHTLSSRWAQACLGLAVAVGVAGLALWLRK